MAPITVALSAEDIPWDLAPLARLRSRPALAVAISVLPSIPDRLIVDLMEHLALALIDREEELHGMREVLSSALTFSHVQHTEIIQLKKRLADLRDANRRERMAA